MAIRVTSGSRIAASVAGTVSAGAATIGGWFKPSNDGGAGQMIAVENASVGDQFSLKQFGGDIYFTARGTGGATEFTVLRSSDVWRHFVLVWNPNTITGYINGVQVGTTSGAQTMAAWQTLTFGDGGDASAAQDAFFYNAALTLGEITQLYRRRRPRRGTNLIAWYPFFSNGDTTSRYIDFSGRGQTLAVTAGSTAVDTQPAVSWGTAHIRPYFLLGGGTTVAIPASTGADTSSGAATVTPATALTAAGGIATAGAATVTIIQPTVIVAASSTATAGAATLAAATTATAAGGVSTAGAASLVVAKDVGSAASTTSTAGAATLVPITQAVANGPTGTSGAATIAIAIAATADGGTATSGAATVSVGNVAVIVGDSTTSTSGAAALATATTLTGSSSTATAGAATVSVSAPTTAIVADGGTASAGAASVTPATPFAAAGGVATLGSTSVVPITQGSSDGTAATAGTAALVIAITFTADGGMATLGAAAVTGGSSPTPGTSGDDDTFKRRMIPVAGRRHVR